VIIFFVFVFSQVLSKIPIVYHPLYNIPLTVFDRPDDFLCPDVEEMGSVIKFDPCKYQKVFDYLKREFSLTDDAFYTPSQMVQDPEFLRLRIHTPEYLAQLHDDIDTIVSIAEYGYLRTFDARYLNEHLVNHVRWAAAGTVLATFLAFEGPDKYAINLGGGFHHASFDRGEGFCFLADIPLAIYLLLEKYPDITILVVDLDAHQGNGNALIFNNNSHVVLFDICNPRRLPFDSNACENIRFLKLLKPEEMFDDLYCAYLERELPNIIREVRPNLIMYIAGSDVLDKDPVGCMHLTIKGLVRRDTFVFRCAYAHNIPIVMTLAGGYTPASVLGIQASLREILVNKKILPTKKNSRWCTIL
jgi:histone deacetylase 11